MSQRRFELVLKSKLVITPGIVQPPEAMGLQEDRVAELYPRSVRGHYRKEGKAVVRKSIRSVDSLTNVIQSIIKSRKINMIEKFEYKGYWYLPSDPDNAIAGILTYIPSESIKLELIGTFEKSTIGIITFSERKSTDIIWGITSDAHEITLINCQPVGCSYNFSCSFPITKFSIQYCLDGIHIDNFKDKRFSWSNIIIPELTIWCHPAALEPIYGFNEKDKLNKISVSVNTDETNNPIISVDLNNSTTLIKHLVILIISNKYHIFKPNILFKDLFGLTLNFHQYYWINLDLIN